MIPDLSKLNTEELLKFVDSFDTVLTDLDGVLWVLGSPKDGSREAVAALESLGKEFFFITNNGTFSVEQYVKNLNRLGYNVSETQVVTPAIGVTHFLLSKGFQGKVHVLGSDCFRESLIKAGVPCTETLHDQSYRTLEDTKNHLRTLDPDTRAVVLDYAPRINYLQLLEATALLKRPDCLFVVGATDYDVPVAHDVCLLGPGYFMDLLQAATGREPVIAGKPSSVVVDVIKSRIPHLDPKRTLFIGDSVAQDVTQGRMAGFTTLLVLSGVSTLEEAEAAPLESRPHFVAPSLAALVPALQKLVSSRILV